MFRLNPLFSEGCVLPAGRAVRLFGSAGDGRVRGTLLRCGEVLAEAECEAAQGRFELCFPPQEAGTGFSLRVTDGREVLCVEDVAVGEVYLAGGQSNMELALCNADGGPEVVSGVDDPLLRYFNVPKFARDTAEAHAAWDSARWQRFTAGQGGDISAVACFFALRLRAWRNVPVGIIDCWWGGTSICCWLDEPSLLETAEGARCLQLYREQAGDKDMEAYLREEQRFLAEMDAWNEKVAQLKRERPGAPWSEISPLAGVCPWNPPMGPGSPYRPCGLAERMLKPLAPVALTGILYYQGEEDTGRTRRYDLLMHSLIRMWRRLFRDEELPFLFVQLPMWIDAGAQDSFLWPALRQAQWKVWRETRNTGLAVLIDQGEYDNIHPTDKKPVGDRLFEQAKLVVYGQPGEESPRPVGWHTAGDGLLVQLSAPVHEREGEAELFELRGADGRWRRAACRIRGSELRLSAPGLALPVAARYAWTDWAKVRVFGENGLPLAPFVLE